MQKPLTIIDDGLTIVRLYPDWIANADDVFEALRNRTKWQSRTINLFGRQHAIPRLECWQSEVGLAYTYSGQTYQGIGWSELLSEWATKLQQQFFWQPNGALLNYYRDGGDSMGWHSDNEPELGVQPNVAIMSLGAERDFRLRNVSNPKQSLTVTLPTGSLLWMAGTCQHEWQHSLPKRAHSGERISCTFRRIVKN